MFAVDQPTVDAIRRAFDEFGELAAIAGLRRHFPLMADSDQARICVRAIAGWQQPAPSPTELVRTARKPKIKLAPK